MILQPFVENAIWHGISGKKDLGWIEVGFTIRGQQLYCYVEDNGIGREAAQKRGTNKHDSAALKITQKRLENLAKEENQPTYYEIKDLKNPSTLEAAGTRVELYLPLLE